MTPVSQGNLSRKTGSMRSFHVTDLNDCEKLWKNYFTAECVSDLWDFRLCFHKYFNNRPIFLILEDHQGIAGILPLSYSNETDTFVFFPGEMWKGKTWLERSPIYLREPKLFNELLALSPENCFLRYIDVHQDLSPDDLLHDEIGYVLYPGDLNYDLNTYRQRFSNKKFKAILKVIECFKNMDCNFHFNRIEDFEILVEMSLHQFGDRSFMADHYFREGFRDVMKYLYQEKLLQMVTIEIDGKIAAVDVGALYKGVYTVFIGGTNPEFPGIAKYINMYHITNSFKQRFHKVDFLCGDFHWKKLWHLDPESLYKYISPSMISDETEIKDINSISETLTYHSTISLNP